MFNLLRHFSFVSAIVFILVTAFLTALYQQHEEFRLIEMTESQNAALARSFANAIWPSISAYVTAVPTTDPTSLRNRPETREIHKILQSLSYGLPILKTKIFSADGLTVYSSHFPEIGEDKRHNNGFVAALDAKSAESKLTFKDSTNTVDGNAEDRNVVESYVPILGSDGRIEGVFALYTDVTPLIRLISNSTILLALWLSLIFGSVYILMVVVVGRADRILKKQHADLRYEIAERTSAEEALSRLNNTLEGRVEKRTAQLKQREKALQISEERFRNYADASSDWHWEMDKELRFTYFSDRFSDVTGVAPRILLGKTRNETGIPNVDPEQWHLHLEDLRQHKPFRNFVHPRVRPDGKTVWLSISAIPYFDDNGEFQGYRGVGSDITELVEAEQRAVEARAEAEAANRSKSAFLANMSHELRTPLNAIIGFSETMLTEIFGPMNSKKYSEQAKVIHQSGHHLLELVNDILDMAKIEADAYELSREPFMLSDVVAETFQLIQVLADHANVNLSGQFPADMPSITADKRAIRQILLNLVSNSVKFTPEGGAVRVSAIVQGDDLTIRVDDNGIGIPADEIPNLTKPFTQGARKHAYVTAEGTGLGLSIVSSLVRLHDGKLEIASNVGEGTRVSIFLPDVLRNVSRISNQ